jgi:hypothetical protein
MVRGLVVFARGRVWDTVARGSTKIDRTPWKANSAAVASPAGPAPAIRTGAFDGFDVAAGMREWFGEWKPIQRCSSDEWNWFLLSRHNLAL